MAGRVHHQVGDGGKGVRQWVRRPVAGTGSLHLYVDHRDGIVVPLDRPHRVARLIDHGGAEAPRRRHVELRISHVEEGAAIEFHRDPDALQVGQLGSRHDPDILHEGPFLRVAHQSKLDPDREALGRRSGNVGRDDFTRQKRPIRERPHRSLAL